MLQYMQPGEFYWADIDGKTLKVRAIQQSKDLSHHWLCSDQNGKFLLVPDTAFHKVGGLPPPSAAD